MRSELERQGATDQRKRRWTLQYDVVTNSVVSFFLFISHCRVELPSHAQPGVAISWWSIRLDVQTLFVARIDAITHDMFAGGDTCFFGEAVLLHVGDAIHSEVDRLQDCLAIKRKVDRLPP